MLGNVHMVMYVYIQCTGFVENYVGYECIIHNLVYKKVAIGHMCII